MDNRLTAVLDSLSQILKRVLAGTPAERASRRAYRFLRRQAATELQWERYDRLTYEVMDRCLTQASNTVDVGCHAGKILRHALERAPAGRHFAFEPIPLLARRLQEKFPTVEIHELALSDLAGTATFHHVLEDEALSGLQPRPDLPAGAEMAELPVRLERLDAILSPDCPIRFIKIDVEGAEGAVLRGAERTLRTWRPLVAFEFGLGAAPAYQTTPADLFDLFSRCGLVVSRLDDWLANRPALTAEGFDARFSRGLDYFFLAHPPRS